MVQRALGVPWGPGWFAPFDLGTALSPIEVKTTAARQGGRLHLSSAELRAACQPDWRLSRVRLPADAVGRLDDALRSPSPGSGGASLEASAARRLEQALASPLAPVTRRALAQVLEALAPVARILPAVRLPAAWLDALTDPALDAGLSLAFDAPLPPTG
ncbi:MAG: hypothetical protein H6742_12395 [Alphaproteobacteria bacterium]|nr:hypothetical protein [Alphaproteobacteria bacterium]